MLAESGLSAFIQIKCPLNSVPKRGLSIVSVLMSLTVMFTFRVQFTCTNYHLPVVFTFLALDSVSYESKENILIFKQNILFSTERGTAQKNYYIDKLAEPLIGEESIPARTLYTFLGDLIAGHINRRHNLP